MFRLSLTAVLLGLGLVSALPFKQLTLEARDAGVSHIALDERTMEYVAYRRDGSLYGRFPVEKEEIRAFDELNARDDLSTSCVQITADDVQKIKGWGKIKDYADKTWGTGSRNIVTNPTEYADRGARACVDSAAAKIQATGPPTCSTSSQTIQGGVQGTSGTINLSYQQGYSSTSTWTVTSTSEFGVSSTLSAKFSLPLDIFKLDIGTEITTTSKFTNSRGNGFDTTASNQITQALTLNNPQGKKCVGTYNVKNCNVGGKGSVRLIASGWVWFNYDDKTKENGQGEEHYKWCVSMDDLLPNVEDRASNIDITGNMKATSNSDFSGKCT